MPSATSSAAVVVEGVSFHYPGTRALDDVSFRIGRGSVTALVGPNGAGKTTLLRCLAGLERPLCGSIEVAGIDVLDEPRLAHGYMGYLSDFFGLYGALSVRQCLLHAASAHGVASVQIADTVVSTAARLDLSERLESRCAELSRGMRQRVAIGQAIMHSPEVLLLDEPASGLDPEARHALAALFTRLRDAGMTLIVSSHILAELDEYCTHMLVLRAGKIMDHRLLASTASESQRVRVTLSHSDVRWRQALAAIAGVAVIDANDTGALVSVSGGRDEHSRVLRELVQAGMPVAGFTEESENLNQSYLRTLHRESEGGRQA